VSGLFPNAARINFSALLPPPTNFSILLATPCTRVSLAGGLRSEDFGIPGGTLFPLAILTRKHLLVILPTVLRFRAPNLRITLFEHVFVFIRFERTIELGCSTLLSNHGGCSPDRVLTLCLFTVSAPNGASTLLLFTFCKRGTLLSHKAFLGVRRLFTNCDQ
jgi:hypothetical protein